MAVSVSSSPPTTRASSKKTIDLIREAFSLNTNEEAFLHHAILRSRLLDIGARKNEAERQVSSRDLKRLGQDAEKTVFWGIYARCMDASKYAAAIRKMYFTFKNVNINNFERLFVVHCPDQDQNVDLQKVAACISRKFFRKGKSPQPYVVFRGIDDPSLASVKQGLWDQRVRFRDGTHFNGDRFRLRDLIAESISDDAFALKILTPADLEALIAQVTIKEAFDFFLDEPLELRVDGSHRRIQIANTEQVLQMIG